MTIQVLSGKPGAGKSYMAAQMIEEAVDAGRCVVTNLPLKVSHPKWQQAISDGLLVLVASSFREDAKDLLHFGKPEAWRDIMDSKGPLIRDDVKDGERKVRLGPLVVVDESAATLGGIANNMRLLKLKDKTDEQRELGEFYGKLIAYFQHHRHTLADVILLYQDYSQITKEIKPLVQKWMRIVNISEMTHPRKMWQMVIGPKGFNLNTKNADKTERGPYKASVYELYDSYAEGAGAGFSEQKAETGLKKIAPLWQRPWFIAGAIGVVALPIFLVMTVVNVGKTLKVDPEHQAGAKFGQATLSKAEAAKAKRAAGQGAIQSASADSMATAQAVALAVPRDPLEMPPDGAQLAAYDNFAIYFRDGFVARQELQLVHGGWKVIEAESCSVIVEREKDNAHEVRAYQCKGGF